MRIVCSKTGEPVTDPNQWRSSAGAPLDLSWEPRIDPSALKGRPATLWRYREVLPVIRDDAVVSFEEGWTPLVPFHLDGRQLLLKLDYLFPSGSYKDRGATVLISRARELGVRTIIEDSSGNAGAAIAMYAARAGMTCDIFVPMSTETSKIAQIRTAGARVHRIEGPRSAAAQAAQDAASASFYASHCWNPFFLHGTKTLAYELTEQLGWRSPDVLVLPLGNGSLLLGAAIGFNELRAAGIITDVPRIIGVQAGACDPLARSFRGEQATPPGPTVATGIAISDPPRGMQIIAAVRAYRGTILSVTEDEILLALRTMLAAGFCIEPTAAAALAGARRSISGFSSGETVVCCLTGHGLKTPGVLTTIAGEMG